MKPLIKHALFGGPGAATRAGDVGFAVSRIGFGLLMFFGHGLSKMFQDGHFGPSAQVVGMVQQIGFPAPTLFAWLSALAECLGALLLAIGLFTRPAALFLVINMCVAAFIGMRNVPFVSPTGGMSRELALLYLAAAVLFLFAGGGRYAVDSLFRRK